MEKWKLSNNEVSLKKTQSAKWWGHVLRSYICFIIKFGIKIDR